jgi:hypothetical protein
MALDIGPSSFAVRFADIREEDSMTSISPFIRRLAGRVALFLAAGTLAACSVDVDQGGSGFDPRPPQVCTREYSPVCGARGNDEQTFANACEARSSGYGIIGRGECGRGGRPDPRPDEGRACTREYAPVCGSRGRDRQTFANACEARSSGFDLIGRGECQIRRPDRDGIDGGRDRDEDRDGDRPGWRDRDGDRDGRGEDRERGDRQDRDRQDRERPRDERMCTQEYAPVCGQRGRDQRAFSNSCMAQQSGYSVVHPGECRAR